MHANYCLRVLVILIVGLNSSACGTTTQRVKVDDAAAAAEAEKQKSLYVSSQLRDQRKIQNLAAPLLIANAELCRKDVRPFIGLVSANVHQWPKAYRLAASSVIGVGELIEVLHVVPGGPAEEAGFLAGDVLVSVDGRAVPDGPKATNKTAELLEKTLEIGKPSTFVVRRGGTQNDVVVTPVVACAYYVVLTGGDEVNAYADGNTVYITKGMMRFVETDSELATVIGHELAHNAMGHSDKKLGNYLLGSVLDVVAAAYGVNTQGAFGDSASKVYSQDFEAEADYVGLYALARAGYDISEAPNLWRRMGADSPGAINSTYGGSHPGTAERYIALDMAVTEILAKKNAGEPLVPNPKE